MKPLFDVISPMLFTLVPLTEGNESDSLMRLPYGVSCLCDRVHTAPVVLCDIKVQKQLLRLKRCVRHL